MADEAQDQVIDREWLEATLNVIRQSLQEWDWSPESPLSPLLM